MPSIRSVCWCFTLNFTGDVPELTFDNKGVQYAVWQHEKVSHDHLQGFLQMKGRRSLLQTKKVFEGYHPHLEVMRAPSAEIARDYCAKEESRVSGPWIFGEFVPMGSNKRKLTELLDNSDNEIEEPQKYRRAMAMKMTKESHQWALENAFPFELKDWQERLSGDLSLYPDDRTIFWVYGPTGGEGKSQFAKYLGLNKNWLYLPGGKVNDMMYMYCKKPKCNLVIDYPRCNKDFVNYAFLEMVKNRTVYSYKYEPVGFIDPTSNVHVVVMANFLPDYERISEDRIKLIDLS
ncbi:replication protein [Hollyhock yellow vein virus associated symptomless alphasatellite]|uniref:Replication protein n=1 Tax=Hollyhock yellow vein virus associated symptomless alphasatellite TaxID=944996 RepID=H1ZWP9_9VIRU|nr:replication protein [Hollyhock yellow vein virus associated symptomless alphasatellite]CBY89000.1 replication protein [Hollyhock yellow vein virus associated symptomless alphasatellite]